MEQVEERTGREIVPQEFGREQIDLIKQTVAKGTTDNELKLFLYTAKRTGLDPLLKQIHAVKRWSKADNREVMAIQTGIDGYRLIAERTGKYAPGKEPTYTYDDKGGIVSATAYVKKLAGGEWHESGATAFLEEYAGRTKDGKPNTMWAKMPHVMIAKCAEALALRRAFPAEMSGVCTFEEMGQEENPTGAARAGASAQSPVSGPEDGADDTNDKCGSDAAEQFITEKQGKRAFAIWRGAQKTDAEVKEHLKNKYGLDGTRRMAAQVYEEFVTWCGDSRTNKDGVS